MAEEYPKPAVAAEEVAVETQDRGLLDRFLGKKREGGEPQEGAIAAELEKVHVSDPEKPGEKKEEKHSSLLEKLHRSDSSSSSSSDEEQGEGGEKKKKKKGLKEIVCGDGEEAKVEDTTVPVEKYEESAALEATEKKGFLEKIKEKLPGQHKKTEEVHPPDAVESAAAAEAPAGHEGEGKEKKGVFEKIKEKIPGYHKREGEEKKESESH